MSVRNPRVIGSYKRPWWKLFERSRWTTRCVLPKLTPLGTMPWEDTGDPYFGVQEDQFGNSRHFSVSLDEYKSMEVQS